MRRVFEALCQRIGHKVALVVNYDGFGLDETLTDTYFEMVSDTTGQVLQHRVRYTTSAFMRMKLGAELSARRSAAQCSRRGPRQRRSLRTTPGYIDETMIQGKVSTNAGQANLLDRATWPSTG